jgi:hypothetical protein
VPSYFELIKRHTINAWSCQHQSVLGQITADGKTNEITAIPELLIIVGIENSLITLDAMRCQQEIAKQIIAKQIIKQKAYYILDLKGNHYGMFLVFGVWCHKSEREV